MGTRSLGEILSDRADIATEIYSQLVEGTQPWGVTVERVEVRSTYILWLYNGKTVKKAL